jgi:hypothetical protein
VKFAHAGQGLPIGRADAEGVRKAGPGFFNLAARKQHLSDNRVGDIVVLRHGAGMGEQGFVVLPVTELHRCADHPPRR